MGAFNAAADAFKLIKKSHFVKRLSAQICQVPTPNCLEQHLVYRVGGLVSFAHSENTSETFDYCSLKHRYLKERETNYKFIVYYF